MLFGHAVLNPPQSNQATSWRGFWMILSFIYFFFPQILWYVALGHQTERLHLHIQRSHWSNHLYSLQSRWEMDRINVRGWLSQGESSSRLGLPEIPGLWYAGLLDLRLIKLIAILRKGGSVIILVLPHWCSNKTKVWNLGLHNVFQERGNNSALLSLVSPSKYSC